MQDVLEQLENGADSMNAADNYARALMCIQGLEQRTRVLILDLTDLQASISDIVFMMVANGVNLGTLTIQDAARDNADRWRELHAASGTQREFSEWREAMQRCIERAWQYEELIYHVLNWLTVYNAPVKWREVKKALLQTGDEQKYKAWTESECATFKPKRECAHLGDDKGKAFEEYIIAFRYGRMRDPQQQGGVWGLSPEAAERIWDKYRANLLGTEKEDFMSIFSTGDMTQRPHLCWNGSRERTVEFIMDVEREAQGKGFKVHWKNGWNKIMSASFNSDSMKQEVTKQRIKRTKGE